MTHPGGRPPKPKSERRVPLHTTVEPTTLRALKREAMTRDVGVGMVIDRLVIGSRKRPANNR